MVCNPFSNIPNFGLNSKGSPTKHSQSHPPIDSLSFHPPLSAHQSCHDQRRRTDSIESYLPDVYPDFPGKCTEHVFQVTVMSWPQ